MIPQQIGGNLAIGTCAPCTVAPRRASITRCCPGLTWRSSVGSTTSVAPNIDRKSRGWRFPGHFSDGARALYRPGEPVDLTQVRRADPVDHGELGLGPREECRSPARRNAARPLRSHARPQSERFAGYGPRGSPGRCQPRPKTVSPERDEINHRESLALLTPLRDAATHVTGGLRPRSSSAAYRASCCPASVAWVSGRSAHRHARRTSEPRTPTAAGRRAAGTHEISREARAAVLGGEHPRPARRQHLSHTGGFRGPASGDHIAPLTGKLR